MPTVLAVDLGKTGCRAAVWTARPDTVGGGPPLATAAGDGAPGLADAGGVDAAERAVRAVADALRDLRPDVVAVGAAGVGAAPAAARDLAERLGRRWPQADVVVAGDAVTSHAGALDGGPGVVLTAGTGSVAVGVATDGRVVQVDGWGPWLGDLGAGAWIGRTGLAAVLAAYDGRGPHTALTDAATAVYGNDLGALPAAVGGTPHPARAAAAFAPSVARAAAGGDDVALGIVTAAADALAGSVLAAGRRIRGDGPVPTALTGGLLGLGPVLTGPLVDRLAEPWLALQAPVGGPLDGARLLAGRVDTVHEPALVRLRGAR